MHRLHFGTSGFGKENQSKDEKLRALQFLVDMGATEAHENEPINRFVANSNVDKPNGVRHRGKHAYARSAERYHIA